jgi:hypothetical protein
MIACREPSREIRPMVGNLVAKVATRRRAEREVLSE